MINLTDLWIGDKVVLKKSKRVGTFLGPGKNGKARIEHNGKIILSSASNLQIYQEPPPKEDLSWITQDSNWKGSTVTDILDLHFEQLRPDANPDQVTNILKMQKEAFNNYLSEVKSSGIAYATIIHGKGEGVLKNEILSIIHADPDIVWYQSVNDGGALQIKLKN